MTLPERSQGWHQKKSQAYLSPHDSNLLMELAPVETRIFLQKGRRWNLHESLRRTHFLSPNRNFLIKKTYMRLMRLSEINYHPKNSMLHRWGKREQVNILSWVSLLTPGSSAPSAKESSADTLQPHDMQDNPRWFTTAGSLVFFFFKPTQTRCCCPHVGILLALHWLT